MVQQLFFWQLKLIETQITFDTAKEHLNRPTSVVLLCGKQAHS